MGAAVIQADRELLVELVPLNTDMPSLGMRIMKGSTSGTEQRHYAQRLIAAGEQLRRRADEMDYPVIEGEVIADVLIAGEAV
jgi:hypothetical protein